MNTKNRLKRRFFVFCSLFCSVHMRKLDFSLTPLAGFAANRSMLPRGESCLQLPPSDRSDQSLLKKEKRDLGMFPPTASATGALLRLRSCYRAYRSPTQNLQVLGGKCRYNEISKFPKILRTLDGASGIPGSLSVTGGEYKTRERIHRSIADLRLLAIPAS